MYSQAEMVENYLPQIEKSGKIARKFREVWARPAIIGEKIVTVTNDGVETENTVNSEGYVVRSLTSAKEEYLVSAEKFLKLYESLSVVIHEDEFTWEKFKSKGVVTVLEVTPENNPGDFEASWGAPMVCKVGDFLCCPFGGSEVYRIARQEFFETYKFEDK